MKKSYIIIPALEPGPELCGYIRELCGRLRGEVILIDDGSGPGWRKIFSEAARIPGCRVLTHRKNLGKGSALKTGFAYVERKGGASGVILCADCDGQHAVADADRMLSAADRHPGCLILGERCFSETGIPLRSRLGNRIASLTFWAACGQWFADTQTGFRAFDGALLEGFLQVPGERFEYEMQMLAACIEKGIPIRTEKIRTIYINGNERSHFRPVRDSFRVMGVLFGEFLRFVGSSCFCAVLDVTVFWLFLQAFAGLGSRTAVIWQATIAARVSSAAVNYLINKYGVFGYEKAGRPCVRYVILCLGITGASAASVSWLARLTGGSPAGIKIWCDAGLFFVSYRLQKRWVFSGRKAGTYERG